MTSAEKELWKYIRKKQIDGHRFRRQYSARGFVLDFYCPKLRLAIEVDGEIHFLKKNQIYDKMRMALLESIGIDFIRFKNSEVLNNINNVRKQLYDKVQELEKRGNKIVILPQY